MAAGITMKELGSGLDPELAAGPLRPARGYDRRHESLTARRRRGDVHRVVACVLAVLALVGCVTAILMLAIGPTAARLDGEISSLDARLSAAQSRLAALQATVAHTTARTSRLTRHVGLLSRHIAGLSRTVHGLQGASTLGRGQSDGLRACVAELQQELSGLTLRTRSVHGRVSSVGLSESAGLSPACGAAFSGG
ncbi:MAG: hypothetical protein ACXVR1_16550 [Solirubrobacteraceae bacterium]